MIKKGHWMLLLAAPLSHHRDLWLSPLGVVPQRDRRPRTMSGCTHFGVNDNTVAPAPQDTMQFGWALQRVLRLTHNANPRFGPVHLPKIDMLDGFCRLGICLQHAVHPGRSAVPRKTR